MDRLRLILIALALGPPATIAPHAAGGQSVSAPAAQDFRGLWPRRPEDIDRLFEPDLLRRDLPLAQETLELDRGQSTIVEALLMDYQAGFFEAAGAFRDGIAGLRPHQQGQAQRRATRRDLSQQRRDLRQQLEALKKQDTDGTEHPELMERLRRQLDRVRTEIDTLRPPRPEGAELQQLSDSVSTLCDQWRREKTSMRERLLGDVQAVLTEEQRGAWPAFERALRRHKTLDRGRLSGESVDLFVVVQALGLTESELAELREPLDACALALDEALVRRNQHLDDERELVAAAMIAGDANRAAAVADREMELRAAVRDVNDRHAEILAEHLGAASSEQGDALRREYRQRADPRIYRRTRAQRAFEVAREIESLSPETLMAVIMLEAEYLARLDQADEQLVRLTRTHEPKRERERLRRQVMKRRGEEVPPRDDPIRAAFVQRTELDEAYRKRLKTLLTPEQAALLPPSRAQLLERLDTDGDGRLSAEERQAGR